MKFIPVNEPLLDGNEKKYLNECIDTGWISSEGPFVAAFEEGMAKLCQRKYAIAVSNGTVALELSMQVLDIEKGSEIIMPAFTIISCAQAIIRAGLKPILVDADIRTWNMDVSQIESKITARAKAIMVVHIYGLPVDMNPVIELARKYGLKVIEDAAEAHGQTYNNIPCGSFGDISIFSFYPNKHITTGEGGMILTDDAMLADKCRGMRNLCHSKKQRFVHYTLGYNYRLTNLQAAIGVAQLERLSEFVLKKKEMGKRYTQALSNMKHLCLPVEKTTYAENIYWVFGVLLHDGIPYNAKKVMKRLAEKGVGTRPFFYPMHLQPVLSTLFDGESFPVSESLAERGFYLPSGLAMDLDKDIPQIVSSLQEVLEA